MPVACGAASRMTGKQTRPYRYSSTLVHLKTLALGKHLGLALLDKSHLSFLVDICLRLQLSHNTLMHVVAPPPPYDKLLPRIFDVNYNAVQRS